MSKFKVGDKVFFNKKEIGCGYDKNWKHAKLNTVYEVTSIGDFRFKNKLEEAVVISGLSDNYRGYVPARLLEKSCSDTFIEPKYKIGYKFITPQDWEMEVVSVKLNKIKKEIYYMCFDLKDGYSVVYSESQITVSTKPLKEKQIEVVEMTLKQVCEKLGKNIKIIK